MHDSPFRFVLALALGTFLRFVRPAPRPKPFLTLAEWQPSGKAH